MLVSSQTMSKSDLRKKQRLLLKEYTQDTEKCTILSLRASEVLFSSLLYQNSSVVFIFISMDTEISTERIIKRALLDGKEVVIPKVNGSELDFYYLQQDKTLEEQLETGAFGILEPKEDLEKLSFETFPLHSLFILPGLAFTYDGKRLGQGKGYYDRFLEKVFNQNDNYRLPEAIIGFCYFCQICETLPMEDQDFFVSHVLTEHGLYSC